MFEGPIGKKMMIEQGYVPATCVMHEMVAGPVIYTEVAGGRDPCAGCNAGGNRSVCGGRPRADRTTDELHSRQRMEEFTRGRELSIAMDPGAPGGDTTAQILVATEEDPLTKQRKIWAMWDASDPIAVGKKRDEYEAKMRAEQLERDRESEAISGKLFDIDEPISKG